MLNDLIYSKYNYNNGCQWPAFRQDDRDVEIKFEIYFKYTC